MLRVFFLSTVLGLGLNTHAQTSTSVPSELDLTSVEIHEVQNVAPQVLQNMDCQGAFIHPLDLNIGWSDIINIGTKVWQIIDAGKPVVNVTTPPSASALPRGLSCWSDLETWQPPGSRSFAVTYKNLLGIQVVNFVFTLHYTYGGSKAGLGKYLTNVTVLPTDLNVLWGYTFDASVAVDPPVNLGTLVDPLAGMGLTLKWRVKTVTKDSQNSYQFFVQGDGKVMAP